MSDWRNFWSWQKDSGLHCWPLSIDEPSSDSAEQ